MNNLLSKKNMVSLLFVGYFLLSVLQPNTLFMHVSGVLISLYLLSLKNRPLIFNNLLKPIHETVLLYAFLISSVILVVMSLLQKKKEITDKEKQNKQNK